MIFFPFFLSLCLVSRYTIYLYMTIETYSKRQTTNVGASGVFLAAFVGPEIIKYCMLLSIYLSIYLFYLRQRGRIVKVEPHTTANHPYLGQRGKVEGEWGGRGLACVVVGDLLGTALHHR
ncbi:hypothetical protein F4859DRAFT_5746 [Xylaria cf. heliscus]|nr:hypothetical protein F4859DRAFT_5746 [Xylaria cf. heliscus]